VDELEQVRPQLISQPPEHCALLGVGFAALDALVEGLLHLFYPDVGGLLEVVEEEYLFVQLK
jgi:hypothetical protein